MGSYKGDSEEWISAKSNGRSTVWIRMIRNGMVITHKLFSELQEMEEPTIIKSRPEWLLTELKNEKGAKYLYMLFDKAYNALLIAQSEKNMLYGMRAIYPDCDQGTFLDTAGELTQNRKVQVVRSDLEDQDNLLRIHDFREKRYRLFGIVTKEPDNYKLETVESYLREELAALHQQEVAGMSSLLVS